ncbi:MAG: hypothetical protein JXB29_07140 [Sedimentisphaerales bacterium]|nr:hypothetical protein [Sedimentisphaerales bacterium]
MNTITSGADSRSAPHLCRALKKRILAWGWHVGKCFSAFLQYEGLPCQEVYRSYTHFCERNGFRPMNSNNFGKEVKRAMPATKKEQKRFGRARTTFYLGLAVKDGSEAATESIETVNTDYHDYNDYSKF